MRGRCVAATAEPVGMLDVAHVGGGRPGPGWIIGAVQTSGNRTGLERTFQVSLVLKGPDGVLELLGGALLFFVSPTQPGSVARFLTQHELSEDPHDLIANVLVHYAGTLTVSASLFGAVYLLLHGLVKIVLVRAVLKDKLWAYPWMVAFLLVFIAYQGYQLVVGFTAGMALLTVFDIFIVLLTLHEYRAHKTRNTHTQPGSRAA